MSKPQWTILIPTIPDRVGTYFPELVRVLLAQVGDLPIHVVGLFDNYQWAVGAKRNRLLELIEGTYFSFIDDDDEIAEDYVATLWEAQQVQPQPDVIVFEQLTDLSGGAHHRCRYGVEYDYWMSEDKTEWTGKPAHTMVWRTEAVRTARFPDEKNCGEDMAWVQQAASLVLTQHRIDKILYYYHFNFSNTRTRGVG